MSNQQAASFIRFGAIALILFGVVFSLVTVSAFAWPTLAFLDLLQWPAGDGLTLDSVGLMLCAITGGVSAGFGVVMYLIVAPLAERGDPLAAQAAPAIWVWYIVDSAGSVLAGVPLNALSNTAFLALLITPFLLWRAPQPAAANS